MKNNGDNYNLTGAPVDNVISMRSEAELQGLTDPKFVWTCQIQCYDNKTVDAGEAMANTHIVMNFLPFTETKSNKTLAAYVKNVGGPENASGFGGVGLGVDPVVPAGRQPGDQGQRRQRSDPRQHAHRAEEHALVRRRRHVGEDGPGRQGELAVLHDPQLRRQEVRA